MSAFPAIRNKESFSMKRVLIVVLAACALLCGAPSLVQGQIDTSAAAPTLKLGDAAPAISVAEWVQGGPVTLDKNAIYVVEFWATWCPGCVQSIPHLSELQAKYKDKGVVIAGISHEDPATIKSFVQEMNATMKYAVGVDNGDATTRAFMDGFGIRTIPSAFVIGRDGRILWNGGDTRELEQVLDRIIAGTYDVAAEVHRAALIKASEADIDAFNTAVDAKDSAKAKAVLESMVTKYSELPALQVQVAWVLMKHPEESVRDPKLALRAAKLAFDGTKGEDFAACDTYANALNLNGDTAEAIVKIQKAIERAPNDELKARFQNTLEQFKAAQQGAPKPAPAAN